MRIIDDETVRAVLSMPTCIDAMTAAFSDLASGKAESHPRQRYNVDRGPANGTSYMANMIAGATNVAALRYDSIINQKQTTDGVTRRRLHVYPQRRSWGFVLLFSLETGEPLACIQDFSLSALRVGATTGVAVKALARENAHIVAMFGSGNEAERNLEAICAVRKIERVKVYSPHREHRDEFAARMTRSLNVGVSAVTTPAEAIEEADIVMCATNSSEPVFDGALLRPGQLVCSIRNTDHVYRNYEVDSTTFIRSDRIVINDLQTLHNNNQLELLDLLQDGRVQQERVVELGAVLIGKAKGREGDQDLIYYKANAGMGIQFAAAGNLIYQECVKQNLGHVVPTEWFGADLSAWLDRGYIPSA